jgi:hypothetical protein
MNRDRNPMKIDKNIISEIFLGICIWSGINVGAAIVERGIPHLAYLLGPIPFAVIGGVFAYHLGKERDKNKKPEDDQKQ